jgi:hypothetical protein
LNVSFQALEEFWCGEQMAQTSGRCFPGSKEGVPKVRAKGLFVHFHGQQGFYHPLR